MLSRIADSLFWLNRYMERADGMLRLAGTHYIFSLDKDVNGTMFLEACPGNFYRI